MDGKRIGKLAALLGAFGLSLATGAVVVPTPNGVERAAAAAAISPTDETKVPHFFGPYPNWANSPQVLADAVVTAVYSGDGNFNGSTSTTANQRIR